MTIFVSDPSYGRGERRRQRTRSAIIGAGQRLFAVRAMEGVTIDDIVAEADVAKGSFYNHFEDKQGLADTILELVHNDCEYHILTANRAVADPAVRLVRALCVMISYADEHPDRLKSLMSLSERRRATHSPLNAGVARDIAEGIGSDRFTAISVDAGLIVATTLIAAAVVNRSVAPAMIGTALLRALGIEAAEATMLAEAAARELLQGKGAV